MNLLSKQSKYQKLQYLIPILACASLIISCIIISAKKIYWNDELYSYYFVSDPSFSKMLVAFHDKINNTPILYFALGWVWDKVFGSTEVSLRLFSAAGMCLGLIIAWVTLRRTYSFWATAFGTLFIFCTSHIIVLQNAEARMYGLFLGLSAVAFWFYDQFCRNREPSNKLLWMNAAVHAAILHTHLFGGFYSGAILVCLFLSDRYFKMFRPRVYLSIMLSWLTILFYIPSFLNQSDAGKPRTWIPAPNFLDLVDMFNISSSPFFKRTLIPLLLFFLVLYYFRTRNSSFGKLLKKENLFSNSEIPLLLFAFVFLIIPVFIWIFSLTIKPIFYDRYMIPTALGWAILFAHIFQRILTAPITEFNYNLKLKTRATVSIPIGIISIFAAIAIFLASPILKAKDFNKTSLYDDIADLSAYPSLPIVVQLSSNTFVQNLHYSTTPDRYYFIVDWEAAVNEGSGTFGPQEFKHLTALKRNYPNIFKNVVTTEEFLSKYDRFLVLDYPNYTRKCPLKIHSLRQAPYDMLCPQWVEMRLLNNTAYKVTEVDDYKDWFSILLVEKENATTALRSSSK